MDILNSSDIFLPFPLESIIIPERLVVPQRGEMIAPGYNRLVFRTDDPELIVTYPRKRGGGQVDMDLSRQSIRKMEMIGRKQNYLADRLKKAGFGYDRYDTIADSYGKDKIGCELSIPKVRFKGPDGAQYVDCAE